MADDQIFDVPAEALGEGAVGVAPPPAQVPRPAAPSRSPTGAPSRGGQLRLKLLRGGRRLLVTGRLAGARKVRLQVRFGSVEVGTRKVRVRGGRFRATLPVGRLRSGRIEVRARAGKATLRASILKRGRRGRR